MKMTIQELRQHQIVVQDPAIDRSEYDAVMNRLRELGEEIFPYNTPHPLIYFFYEEKDWMTQPLFNRFGTPLTFDEFMNLEIESAVEMETPIPWPESKPPFPASGRYPTVDPKAPK